MSQYKYTTSARWTGARRGEVTPDSGAAQIQFSAPPEFQGDAGKWTPEHFFMAAVTSCFVTTFRAIAEFSKYDYNGLEVSAEGLLEKADGGFQFTKVIVRPTLTVNHATDA
jgi:organic hydroperoxide reductase OsmC/OhrA